MAKDKTTEEKIKASAKEIFMKKGFSATKTRDIADLAGINLALVNYYFRSKENLYQLIMMETMQDFFSQMRSFVFQEDSSLEEKLNYMAEAYIELLLRQPDMPLFLLNEMQSNPVELANKLGPRAIIKESVLFRQLGEQLKKTGQTIHPLHFIFNLLSLIIMPFAAKPMLRAATGLKSDEFEALMKERKALIPKWIMILTN
jgi:AcrR family transcriptional regulator